MSNSKKRPAGEPREDVNEPIVFRVLKGASKASDFATFNLLVQEDFVGNIAEALRKADYPQYVWNIGDEEISDIQSIPPIFARPIRSITEIPEDKTESELLDWLIHGESFFSKKYVVLKFIDTDFGDNLKELGRGGYHAYEISKKEHFKKFYGAAKEILRQAKEGLDQYCLYLDRVEVLDRGGYRRRHDGCTAVDDELVNKFEEMAKSTNGHEAVILYRAGWFGKKNSGLDGNPFMTDEDIKKY